MWNKQLLIPSKILKYIPTFVISFLKRCNQDTHFKYTELTTIYSLAFLLSIVVLI